jgi:4-hydroxybutyrate CoA-transferase
MPIDVALIQVSPPDAHGFCSYGVGVDTTLTAAKCARRVIAQVNPQMPRTCGDCFIHVSEIDAIVEYSGALCELPREEISDVQRAVARHVASLIEDGDTLQLGIGGIPDAVLLELAGRKDLGVHTEMLSDSAIPLIESGVINGRRKTLHPRKIVLSFVLGASKPSVRSRSFGRVLAASSFPSRSQASAARGSCCSARFWPKPPCGRGWR